MKQAVLLASLIAFATSSHAEEYRSSPIDTIHGSCSLNITSSPAGAEVILDGRSYGFTPIVCGDLPLGKHVLTVRLEGYFDHNDTLTFDTAKLFVRDVQLVQPGLLTVISDPPDADVLVDGVRVGKTPLTGFPMKPGIIFLRVEKQLHNPFEQNVVIQQGRESNVSTQLRPRQGSLTVRVVPPTAQVLIDGKNIGEGSLEKYELDAGTYTISLQEGGHEIRHRFFVPPGSSIEIIGSVNQFSMTAFWQSTLLPGLGQLTHGNVPKGIAMMIGWAGSAAFLASAISDYSTKRDNYDLLRAAYRSANNEAAALQAGANALSAYQTMESSFKTRRTAILIFGAVYALILTDAYLHHTRVGGFEAVPIRQSGSVEPMLSADEQMVMFGVRLIL